MSITPIAILAAQRATLDKLACEAEDAENFAIPRDAPADDPEWDRLRALACEAKAAWKIHGDDNASTAISLADSRIDAYADELFSKPSTCLSDLAKKIQVIELAVPSLLDDVAGSGPYGKRLLSVINAAKALGLGTGTSP